MLIILYTLGGLAAAYLLLLGVAVLCVVHLLKTGALDG
jgi:hypothetical protein